jgi:carbonic anhydrase
MDWASRFRRSTDDVSERPETPDEAIAVMLAGNARFIGEAAPDVAAPSTVPPADPADLGSLKSGPTPTQRPFCVVLGCSDARVPSELVFGVRPNQLFVVRVAGNVLGEECLGSIEYALHSFKESVHLLVVLGHTRCGAVGAAVDAYLRPTESNSMAFTRSLRSVVNHVLIAVRGAAVSLEECWGPAVAADPGYRDALLEVSVYLNAGMTAYHLREELRPDETFGTRVVFGVFDVATCRVIGPDLDPQTDDTSKLAEAASHPDGLVALGRQIAGSPMAARHLSKEFRQSQYPTGGI